jgi:hypothetical protein
MKREIYTSYTETKMKVKLSNVVADNFSEYPGTQAKFSVSFRDDALPALPKGWSYRHHMWVDPATLEVLNAVGRAYPTIYRNTDTPPETNGYKKQTPVRYLRANSEWGRAVLAALDLAALRDEAKAKAEAERKERDAEHANEMAIKRKWEAAPEMYAALKVVAKTVQLRALVGNYDPKALQQIDAAIKLAEEGEPS